MPSKTEYWKRKAKGLCTMCGHPRDIPTNTCVCSKCRDRQYKIINRWHSERGEKQTLYKRNQMREWYKNNRTKWRLIDNRRRSKELGAAGSATVEQMQGRIDYYGGLCYICQSAPYEAIDHVIPLAKNGTNWPANLRPICRKHNAMKHTMTLQEFYEYAPDEFAKTLHNLGDYL